ncbi:MAG: glycosyltransferase family 92 protein [Rickettsiales bacterium]|jgi:hypothetical protein|nr:glycosyltransferase family 92 protein [Rickettsiales bacterium]
MKKTLINIAACFALGKDARGKFRNALWFGLAKSIRARLAERRLKFPHKLAVVAIAKNEAPYFREWIEFHKLVGVEKFYIYDNESTDNTKEVLEPYIKSGLVEYTFIPGERQQHPAYRDCVAKHKFDTEWLAFIDLDEFLVPQTTSNGGGYCATIPGYLDSLPRAASMVLAGWVMYGSNGHETKPEGLVVENFKTRADSKNVWLPGDMYKSVAKPRFITDVRNHRQKMFAGKEIAEYFGKISDWRLRCNHYHCKSWEEYQKRAPRGAAYRGIASGATKYTREHFDFSDQNDVPDPIMDKYIPALKAKLS